MLFSTKGSNLIFRINLNDFKFDDFISLTLGLEGVTVEVNSNDTRIWINKSSGNFSCKSYFELLMDGPNIIDFDNYTLV